jgi:DNA-binding MarR family transcriptional regulator
MGARTAAPSMAGSGPDGLDASIISTIPPLMRYLLSYARRRAAWGEMTYQQYSVLRVVEVEGPTSQRQIAEMLLISAPVVTRLAGALLAADLVKRHPHPRDRRTVHLVLTPKGRQRVKKMRLGLLSAAGELVEPLPEVRRVALAAALEELRLLLADRRRGR